MYLCSIPYQFLYDSLFYFSPLLFLGNEGTYQNLLHQVTLPYVEHDTCQTMLRNTRLGENFGLDDSFNCAGGECFSLPNSSAG